MTSAMPTGIGHVSADSAGAPARAETDLLARRLAELERATLHDPLTQLPNRALLGTRLEEAVSQATESGAVVALLVCDLDRFATVNDTLGQQAGDDLLRAVAQRLASMVPASHLDE